MVSLRRLLYQCLSLMMALLFAQVVLGAGDGADLVPLSETQMQQVTGSSWPDPDICCGTEACCENTCGVEDDVCYFQYPQQGYLCIEPGEPPQDGCWERDTEYDEHGVPEAGAQCCIQYRTVIVTEGCHKNEWSPWEFCSGPDTELVSVGAWHRTCDQCGCKYYAMHEPHEIMFAAVIGGM